MWPGGYIHAVEMKAWLKELTPARVWEAAHAVKVRLLGLGYRRARWPRPLGTRPPIALAVCAIFRDEARYLAEWVSFQRVQGVERFYLYDNRSADDWRSELELDGVTVLTRGGR